MKTYTTLTISLLLTIFLSCRQASKAKFEREDYSQIYSDTSVVTGDGFISSSAAAVSKDTLRKFIRTADLKFRVKDVRKATLALEDICANFDGYVTYTNLTSFINRTEITPVSIDSSLETIYYTVTNDLVIRVLNTKLDSTLRTMAILIDYLDYRTIKAQDVTLSFISNKLTQKRIDKHSDRLSEAINEKGKKLKETYTAEENVYSMQEQLDKTKLSTLSIQDQIDFSTININIYQRQAVKRDLIENYKNIDSYQPSFFNQVWDSILAGWSILKKIIIGLISIWPFILFGLLCWFVYKKYFRKS